MPLLWVLRDRLNLTGTKYGCGAGLCGACTVLHDDRAVRSCTLTIAAADGQSYTTIEGLSADATHPCQRAWIDEDVAQCGYCQPGMIMETAALLRAKPSPTVGRHRRRDRRTHLPLRHLHPAARGGASRGGVREVTRLRASRDGVASPTRRRFLRTTAAAGLVLAFDLPAPLGVLTRGGRRCGVRAERAPARRIRRHRDAVGDQAGDGPGRAHAAADDPGRGARGRLDARPDRTGVARRALQGHRAAHQRQRQQLGGVPTAACGRAPRRGRCWWPPRPRPGRSTPASCRAERGSVVHVPTGRRQDYGAAGRRRRAAAGADAAGAEGSIGVHAARQADEARRRSGDRLGPRRVRARRARARHVVRVDRARAHARRHARAIRRHRGAAGARRPARRRR